MVNIQTKYMTKNDCYKANRKITVKGIMVHLTATVGVMAKDWFSRWNKSGISKCVHYFVDDKEIWQYLPDNHRGWHAGGSANNDHIGIEGCEPPGHRYSGSTPVGYDVKKNEKYFNDMYKNMVDLIVHLCKKHGLTEKDVIGHIEGGYKGIASRSADPEHLFKLHKKSMDILRADVKKKLQGGSTVTVLRRGSKGAAVKQYQQDLITLGYDFGRYGADGSFGAATEATTKQFQRDNKLTVDGIAGPATQAKVKELLAARGSNAALEKRVKELEAQIAAIRKIVN